MKRQRITLAQIAARDNLVLALWKAARGRQGRAAVQRFQADAEHRLDALARAILDGRAPLGLGRSFTIHDPKRRVIHAACFPDRVLHHAILNLAEPRFEQMLVASSHACRPGHGVHRAVSEVQAALQRWPWFVQVDVLGYFPSIDHAILKALLATRFKGDEFLALLGRIIDTGSPATPGRGLPIGALSSQHFANAYLDGADRWLLAHPAVRAHVRYMDDIVWWCESRNAAQQVQGGLHDWLWRERRLVLKAGAQPRRSADGIAYCGFRVRQGVVLPSTRKLARYRAGAQRLLRAEAAGRASGLELQRAHDALLATLERTQSLHFRQRLWPAA